MDCEFLMVPKNWVDKILVFKLLLLTVSLTSELKIVTRKELKGSKLEDEINLQGR